MFLTIIAGEAFGGCSESFPCENDGLECIKDKNSPVFGTCVFKFNGTETTGNSLYGIHLLAELSIINFNFATRVDPHVMSLQLKFMFVEQKPTLFHIQVY